MKTHSFCFKVILSVLYLSQVVFCATSTADTKSATTTKSDEFEDFTKWKTALNDVALRALFDKYIYEEPRSTEATGTKATKTVTAAIASLSKGGGGTQDLNKLTPAGYPISVQQKTLNNGKDYEYNGINKSPSKPVQINDAN